MSTPLAAPRSSPQILTIATPGPICYGSWLTRVAATLLDGVAVFAALMVLMAFGAAVGGAVGVAVVPIVVLLVILLYTPLMQAYWNGQTLGKRAVGLAVRRPDGGPIGLGTAFVRYFSSILLGLIVFVGLVDVIWPWWDARNQTLHDKLATTIVVTTRG